jgi:hypothetical protein
VIALIALALFAQIAVVQGYTLADPLDPERFVLATHDGRVIAEAANGCHEFTVYQNVLVWQQDDPSWLILTPLDATPPGCVVSVIGPVPDEGNVPCLVDALDACDATLELPPND